jgi:hypothetical protein
MALCPNRVSRTPDARNTTPLFGVSLVVPPEPPGRGGATGPAGCDGPAVRRPGRCEPVEVLRVVAREIRPGRRPTTVIGGGRASRTGMSITRSVGAVLTLLRFRL